MAPVLLPSWSAALAVEAIAEQENNKPGTTSSGASVTPLSKKPIKGGGNKKKVGKKRGRKKKVVGKGDRVAVSDVKDVAFVHLDYDSADHGETTTGEASDDSDYGNIAPVAKRVVGKGVFPKTPGAKKTVTDDLRPARKPYTRRSGAAKTPEKKGGKSTPGRKGKATGTSKENPVRFDDPDDGYYPDDDNENDGNYAKTPKTPRTPAMRAAKKAPRKTVQKATDGKTTRKTTADKKMLVEGTGKPATRPSTGRKGPMVESKLEYGGKDVDMLEEPLMTAGTKRPALKTPDDRLRKVAKTAAGKSVGAIKAGLKALVIFDHDGGEAGVSGGQFFGTPPAGYSIEGGTSEQCAAITAAASSAPSAFVVRSEPAIRRDRLSYGGKSVPGLKALWEMGLLEHDSE
ncbi:hypothetical protein HOY80DRAFT_1026749 [Tuber brumale]|nr:hypothetical protein HOY80DRAFT_1026749 [Tuber brumale]